MIFAYLISAMFYAGGCWAAWKVSGEYALDKLMCVALWPFFVGAWLVRMMDKGIDD